MKNIRIQRKPVSFKWYVPSLIAKNDEGEMVVEESTLDSIPYILATRLNKRDRAGIADSMMFMEMASGTSSSKMRVTQATTALDYCVASIRGFGGISDENGESLSYSGDEGDIDALLDALDPEDYAQFSDITSGNISLDDLKEMKNVDILGKTLVN